MPAFHTLGTTPHKHAESIGCYLKAPFLEAVSRAYFQVIPAFALEKKRGAPNHLCLDYWLVVCAMPCINSRAVLRSVWLFCPCLKLTYMEVQFLLRLFPSPSSKYVFIKTFQVTWILYKVCRYTEFANLKKPVFTWLVAIAFINSKPPSFSCSRQIIFTFTADSIVLEVLTYNVQVFPHFSATTHKFPSNAITTRRQNGFFKYRMLKTGKYLELTLTCQGRKFPVCLSEIVFLDGLPCVVRT